ncbi:MAG: hypothetical protein WAQ08_18030 [Aquabacterium sp.]|jgi:hypothetical protein|uniref:hypothetical protein n=1 Tax=Aquabacterium sp. TaxID=1872578 RepID=UPI003BAE4C1D
MNAMLFSASLLIAVAGPIIALSYLRPILLKVLRSFCDADGGAEFWVRSAYLLAVSGTVFLCLVFGRFDPEASTVDTLRRALLIVIAGVFVTAAFIATRVWGQVQIIQAAQAAAQTAQTAPAWPGDREVQS